MRALKSSMSVSSLAYGRRPQVRREPTQYGMLRVTQATRYRRGMPVGLYKKQVPVSKPKPTLAERRRLRKEALAGRSFFVRHRMAFATLSVLLVVAIVSGVMLRNMYTSNTLLAGNDESITGTATVVDRVTTTPELAEKVSYFLIVGVDASSMLTDCIWIMCFDNAAHKVNVMQVPRDTYVGSQSASGKINGVYSNPKSVKWCETCGYAPNRADVTDGVHNVCGNKLTTKRESNISSLIRNINEHLGLPIDHFVIFDFEGFVDIINKINGVEITLDHEIDAGWWKLPVGTSRLYGADALAFMRNRKTYAEGDIGRVSAQRLFISALMDKMLSMDKSSMLNLVVDCAPYFKTDLSLEQLLDYAGAARNLSTDSLNMFTMPGHDHWVKPNPSYYVCNEAETVNMINQYMLPYGLPGGGYATASSVNFPEVVDSYTQSDETTTTSSAVTTTPGYTTSQQTEATTAPTPPPTHGTTTTTAATTPPTSQEITTTTTTATTTVTTTTTTTTQPPTTTTTAPPPVDPPDEAQGQQLSALSNPRAN